MSKVGQSDNTKQTKNKAKTIPGFIHLIVSSCPLEKKS